MAGSGGNTPIVTATDQLETLITAGNASLADLQDALTADAAAITSVNDQDTNINLLASAATRRGVIIHNNSAGILYIKYGATATASAGGYTYKIPADGTWEMPGPIYTGAIDGIWTGATTGAASITELT